MTTGTAPAAGRAAASVGKAGPTTMQRLRSDQVCTGPVNAIFFPTIGASAASSASSTITQSVPLADSTQY